MSQATMNKDDKIYTLALCKFNRFSEATHYSDTKLNPMTISEANTFKSKMSDPSRYMVITVKELKKKIKEQKASGKS